MWNYDFTLSIDIILQSYYICKWLDRAITPITPTSKAFKPNHSTVTTLATSPAVGNWPNQAVKKVWVIVRSNQWKTKRKINTIQESWTSLIILIWTVKAKTGKESIRQKPKNCPIKKLMTKLAKHTKYKHIIKTKSKCDLSTRTWNQKHQINWHIFDW